MSMLPQHLEYVHQLVSKISKVRRPVIRRCLNVQKAVHDNRLIIALAELVNNPQGYFILLHRFFEPLL